MLQPLLQNRTLLVSYLAAWAVPMFVLLNVLIIPGHVSPFRGFFLGVPLGLVFAALGAPIYYVCRGNPIGGSQFPRALMTHITAAILYGMLWQLVTRLSAFALMRTGWGAEYAGVLDLSPLIFGTGVLSYTLTAGIFYVNLASMRSTEAEKEQVELKAQASGAELQALRAQVNPHFLFNSLHSISSMTVAAPEKARAMCVRLADLLRLTLGLGERRLITLDQEFKIVDNYLEIEQYRLGDRLQTEIHIDDSIRTAMVPPLVVQPLVENAILHGVATIPEGGTLEVRVYREQDELKIKVRNPYDPHAPKRPGTGTGQRNLRSRLETQFGKEGSFRHSYRDNMYEAVITLPLIRGGAA